MLTPSTVSAFLAGIKRSTGLTYAQPQPNTFSKTESVLLKSLRIDIGEANDIPTVGDLAPDSNQTRSPRARS